MVYQEQHMPDIKWEGLWEAICKWQTEACNDNFMVKYCCLSFWSNTDDMNEKNILLCMGIKVTAWPFAFKWLSRIIILKKEKPKLKWKEKDKVHKSQSQQFLYIETHTRREQQNEYKKRGALTSIDISISGTQRCQSICLNSPPSPFLVLCVQQLKQLLR